MTCDAACYTLSTEEWPRRFINLGADFLFELMDISFEMQILDEGELLKRESNKYQSEGLKEARDIGL